MFSNGTAAVRAKVWFYRMYIIPFPALGSKAVCGTLDAVSWQEEAQMCRTGPSSYQGTFPRRGQQVVALLPCSKPQWLPVEDAGDAREGCEFENCVGAARAPTLLSSCCLLLASCRVLAGARGGG